MPGMCLRQMQLFGVQLEKLSQQLQAAQKDLEAARSAEAAARSKAAAEAKQRATQKAEAEAAAANLRSEHAAELARLASARKKLEVQLGAFILGKDLKTVFLFLQNRCSALKIAPCACGRSTCCPAHACAQVLSMLTLCIGYHSICKT